MKKENIEHILNKSIQEMRYKDKGIIDIITALEEKARKYKELVDNDEVKGIRKDYASYFIIIIDRKIRDIYQMVHFCVDTLKDNFADSDTIFRLVELKEKIMKGLSKDDWNGEITKAEISNLSDIIWNKYLNKINK